MRPLGRLRVTTARAVIALALTAGAVACDRPEPKSALSYTADAKKAYDAAMEEFQAHNWLEAQTLLREVRRKYAYSKYAKLAELRLADSDFEQDKFAEAIRGYRQFVHDHRSDTAEVSYARSRIAEAQYRQISDSFLLPTADERDQGVILDSFKELKGYLHDYPDSDESAHIRDLLGDVTARLVRHELYVARFYLARDNYEAAVLRIQYALRNFASGPQYREPKKRVPGRAGLKLRGPRVDGVDSGLEAEALLLLGETYLKMHKWQDARGAFNAIVRDYPRSPLIVQAENYLAFMKERGV
jgi:outer membrane protein assembly factor BamD